MRRAGKLFDCSRQLKSCFNAYVSPSLDYSSAESYLDWLDSIVRSAEWLCEDDLFCLADRRKVSALCLLYEIHHSVGYTMNGHLNHFVALLNTSAVLGELALVIQPCRTDEFSRPSLPAAVRR